ncbi:hypothetical protein DL98DRAFT_152771 [Cadophora sp. DSE1049]|nr:hypothetical protein DL98DRAFT_152771 [Cadophora sp. DSE1049]
MQSHVDPTDEQRPVLPNDNRNRVSDIYVLRKTVNADNAKERCYFCYEDWQSGDGMVRLRCCNHWLHEDCLSKSVLDGRCPTCRIWLASLDKARVLAGAAEMGDVQRSRSF